MSAGKIRFKATRYLRRSSRSIGLPSNKVAASQNRGPCFQAGFPSLLSSPAFLAAERLAWHLDGNVAEA
jgi:hypothetical protein